MSAERPTDTPQRAAELPKLPPSDVRLSLGVATSDKPPLALTHVEQAATHSSHVAIGDHLNFRYDSGRSDPNPSSDTVGAVHRWGSAATKGRIEVRAQVVDQPSTNGGLSKRTLAMDFWLEGKSIDEIARPYVIPAFLARLTQNGRADGIDQVQISPEGLDGDDISRLIVGTGIHKIDRYVSRFDLRSADKAELVKELLFDDGLTDERQAEASKLGVVAPSARSLVALKLAAEAERLVMGRAKKNKDTKENEYPHLYVEDQSDDLPPLETTEQDERALVAAVQTSLEIQYAAGISRALMLDARAANPDPSVPITDPELYFDEHGTLVSGAGITPDHLAMAIRSLPLDVLAKPRQLSQDVRVNIQGHKVVVKRGEVDASSLVVDQIRSKSLNLIANPEKFAGGNDVWTIAGRGVLQRVTPDFRDLEHRRPTDFKAPSRYRLFRNSDSGHAINTLAKLSAGSALAVWGISAVAEVSTNGPKVWFASSVVAAFFSRKNARPVMESAGKRDLKASARQNQSTNANRGTTEIPRPILPSVESERAQLDNDGIAYTNSALDRGRDVDGDGAGN